MIVLLINRKHERIVKFSPPFLLLFLFGILGLNLSVVTWMPNLVGNANSINSTFGTSIYDSAACYARIWTGPIFYLLTFLPLIVTGWRIAVIFSANNGLKVFKISDGRLWLIIGIVVTACLIFPILLTSVSGVSVQIIEPVAFQAIHNYALCVGGNGFLPIVSVWIGFIGILLIAGIVVMSWVRNRTRNSAGREYDRSDTLWYSIFTSGVILLIILISQFIVKTGRPETGFVILYVSIFIGTIIQEVVIFAGVFKSLYGNAGSSIGSGTALKSMGSSKALATDSIGNKDLPQNTLLSGLASQIPSSRQKSLIEEQ